MIFTCRIPAKQIAVDLEVPADVRVNELIRALSEAYEVEVDLADARKCYLHMENPIRLLRGEITLKDAGVRNGSMVCLQ